MQVTLREQFSTLETTASTGLGLVLCGGLFNNIKAETTEWSPSYTEIILPHANATDIVVSAKVLRLYATLPATVVPTLSEGQISIDTSVPYSGGSGVELMLAFMDNTTLSFYVLVEEVLCNEDGISHIRLAEPLPKFEYKTQTLSLVGIEDVVLRPDKTLAVTFPFPLLAVCPVLSSTVNYRVPDTDTHCVRITPDNCHQYCNPILDCIPSFDQIFFINTNAKWDTNKVLYNSKLYDYYFVPLDGCSISELLDQREFHQTFEYPVIDLTMSEDVAEFTC